MEAKNGKRVKKYAPGAQQSLCQREKPVRTGFDPSAVVDFNELVAAQDNMVCERVQQGVSSRAFSHGVLSPKDDLVVAFTHHYLAARGPVDASISAR